MKEIILMMKIYFILILIAAANMGISAQSGNLQYYTVMSNDSVYIFLSNQHLLLLSSQEYSGEFNYLSTIEGSFTAQTKFSFTDHYLLVLHADTLNLYDISDPNTPSLISREKPGFIVDHIERFGPYFVCKVGNIVKLLQPEPSGITIKEDSLINHSSNLYYYPYIFQPFQTFYKYVEGFGVYEIYSIEDAAIWRFIGGDRLVYGLTYYSPPVPPVCYFRARKFEEPDFPMVINVPHWPGCLNPIPGVFREGSARFIYLFHQPTNLVLNYAGSIIYHYSEWDYILKTTDNYVFLLKDHIKFAPPSYYLVFSHLNYTTSISDNPTDKLIKFDLKQNFPNPFNSSTTIEFNLPGTSHVKLFVVNVIGETIEILIDNEMNSGNHHISFNAENLPSGVYFYTIQTQNFLETKKMVLLR